MTKKQQISPVAHANEWLTSKSDQLARWCVDGSGLDAATLVRVGVMVVQREPKLQDPRTLPSLYVALITAAQLGLEPSGPMGEGHIIPYWDKKAQCNLAQFQPGYRGLIKLMLQSGEIKRVRSHAVMAHDEFAANLMDPDDPTQNYHRIALGDRGKPVAVYSRVQYTDGSHDIEVAGWDEVDKARSSAKGKSPAWDMWPEQMARKFIVKRHANQMPLSPVARRAIAIDNIDSDSMAEESQEIIDAEVASEEPAAKEQSKLGAKLAKRKRSREMAPPAAASDAGDAEEFPWEEENTCDICRQEPVQSAGEICDGCQAGVDELESRQS